MGAATLAFAVASPAAWAADTTIDFETLPGGQPTTNGQAITTQYQPSGVTFGVSPTGSAGITPRIRALPAGQAQSGDRALDIRDGGGEFTQTDVWGGFDSPRSRVSVYVGLYAGGAATKIALEGYSLSGSKIDTASATVSGLGIHTKLEVSYPTFSLNPTQIAYFRVYTPDNFISGSTPFVAIDDVAFPALTGPPQPDFGLVWTNSVPGSDAVTLKKGESVSTGIKINRAGGSSGPIGFAASGLPTGVHASFVPNPAAGASTTLTLTADSNAPGVTKQQITVTGDPAPSGGSAGAVPRQVKVPVTVIGDYDLQVTGIEVTQNIQFVEPNVHDFNPAPSLPTRDPAHPFDPVVYECCSFAIGSNRNGVRLARGKPTTVRVFANVAAPLDAQVSEAQVRLHGFELKSQSLGDPTPDAPKPDESKPLPGSPLLPNQLPAKLTGGSPYVTNADRTNPGADYRFSLPGSWMKSGGIALRAEVEAPPPALFGNESNECEGQQCKLNNSFTLAGMTFSVMPKFSVTPVAASSPGVSGLPSSATAFQRWAELFPVPASKLTIAPYQGTIDVSDALDISDRTDRDSELLDLLDDWLDDNEDKAGSQAALVTSFSVSPGVSESEDIVNPAVGFLSPYTTHSVVPFDSPTRNLPHELFHGYGQAHASSCGGGGAGDQKAVSWPPDGEGWIRGIGFSRSGAGNGGVIAPPSTVTGKSSGTDGQWFDIMSYCASNADAWLSTRNWNDAIEELRTYRKVLQGKLMKAGSEINQYAQESAVRTGLEVNGYLASDGGVRLTRVRAGRLPRAAQGTQSDLMLSVLDGSGRRLASAPVLLRVGHGHMGGTVAMLEAGAPLAGAARAAATGGAVGSVQIERGGQVVARLARSAHAPRVRVLAPRAGVRVGRGRTVTVRWRAADADGDRLSAKVDYSLDGGRNWRPVATGLHGQRAVLPSALFAASRRARVRVRVNDGFDEASAASGLFRAAGRPPRASIASPTRGERLRADGLLFMSGGAVDDAGRAIGPRSLRWFIGRRPVGRGNEVSRQGLPAGRRRVRLVAVDRLGRRATASTTILVAPVPPAFVTLRAPARLSPRTRRLVLTVSSNVAATLRIGSRRFSTDRSPRRIAVAVRPGRTPLTLRLSLTAGRQTARRTLTIARA